MRSVGFLTLLKKENRRFLKVFTQTVLSPVISTVLFLLIFGVTLEGRGVTLEGVSYLQFLVPGLVAMGLINNAFSNSSSSLIISKYHGTLEDLLKIPLSAAEIVWAYTFSAVFRGVIVALMTLVVGLIFVGMPMPNIPLLILISFLVGCVWGLFGIVVAVLSKTFDHLSMIQNFVMTPLVYLGGVFYSVSQIPESFQLVSYFNPLFYMIDGLRYAFLGVSDMNIYVDIVVTVALLLIFYVISFLIFRRGWKLKS